MIHTIHLFIGEQLNRVASSFAKYTARLGEVDVLNYYTTVIWEKQAGNWIAKELKPILNSQDNSVLDDINFTEEETIVTDDNIVRSYFRQLYTDKVTILKPGVTNELKVCIYFPLYYAVNFTEIERLLSQIPQTGKHFSFDLIGLSADFAKLIEADKKFDDDEIKKEEKSTIQKVIGSDVTMNKRFILFQNFTSNGVALNFDFKSLVITLGELALSITEKYYEVFPINVEQGEVTGVGMSVLSLDRLYFVNYLMRRSFLRVLDEENINQEEVDINKIQPIIQKCLQAKVDIYHNFFDREITKRLESGMSHDMIISEISPLLKAEFKQLNEEFQAFLSDTFLNLSLPEKRAALALLTGQDDSYLDGYLFNKNNLIIDDCYSTPISLFVDENNKLVSVEHDASGKVLYSTPGPIKNPIDSQTSMAEFPLEEIKFLKGEMMQTSNTIRQWEGQLTQLQAVDAIEIESKKRLTEHGFVYDQIEYKLLHDIIEEPLKEDYSPGSVKPAKEVDLRDNFTKVKDQGEIGTCSAFAIASIYEYLLKKKGLQDGGKDFDLSERFVYYHTNILTGRGDTGSTYKDVLDVISQKGICSETLCPYDTQQLEVAPTEEAIEEAKNHLVVEAKNVQIEHNDIVCALTEGYPVAISLKIYDSFGNGYKGFVSRPTQEEIDSNISGNHAMVICGFSEEDKVYIVRNSWGTKFGDKGYCYIPFSYVEDTELNNYCCIVTKTLDGEVQGLKGKQNVTFDKTDSKIRQVLLGIKIGEERLYLNALQNRYNTKQYNYQNLLLNLENQSLREQIFRESVEQLNRKREFTDERYKRMVGELPKKLDEFRKQIFSKTVLFIIAIFLWGLLSAFAWYFEWSEIFKYTFSGITLLLIGYTVMLYSHKKNQLAIYKEELESDIAYVKSEIRDIEKEISEKKLRLHFAGMVIDRISLLKTNLISKYHISSSYVGNLKVWYEETKNNIEDMNCDVNPPFMNVLKNEVLDRYFEEHYNTILEDVKFSTFLNDYQIDEESAIAYREKLHTIISARLYKILDGFNMYNYISKQDNYPYLDSDKLTLEDKISEMDRRSDIFLTVNLQNPAESPIMKYIMANVPESQRLNWIKTYQKQFHVQPTDVKILSCNKIVVMTVQELCARHLDLLRG